MRRGDHETDDALLAGEVLDRLEAGLGIVERQIEHRFDARLFGKDALAQPSVVGPGEIGLGVDVGRQRQIEHRGRKQTRKIGPDCVHPAPHQRDVTVRNRRHLLQPAAPIADDAPVQLLIGAVADTDSGPRHALERRVVPQHRVGDVFGNLGKQLVFIVMRVDIDDQKVLVMPLDRLLPRVGKSRRGVVTVSETSRNSA